MKNFPKISIIIPCRNEEVFIGKCLNSIVSQNYPKDRVEVLITDGMSTDSTREIVRSFFGKLDIKIIENYGRYTPIGLNLAIKKATGDVLARIDAHSYVNNDYIKNCVRGLRKYNADSVGGVLKTLPRNNSFIDKTIVRAFVSRFGTGNSYYKLGSKYVKEVDTAAFFCCPKETFEKNGLFNEKLIRTQDMEWHKRLKKNGGRIFLLPNAVVYYYIKSDLKGFIRHNFVNGIWATLPFKYSDHIPVSFRHLIPLFFVLGIILLTLGSWLLPVIFIPLLLAITLLYSLLSVIFAIQIAIKEKNIIYVLTSPIAFLIIHFGYGLGSLWGLILFLKKDQNGKS